MSRNTHRRFTTRDERTEGILARGFEKGGKKQKSYVRSLDYKTTLMSGRVESFQIPTTEQSDWLILVIGPRNELTWLYYKTVCLSFHGTEFGKSTGYSLLPGQRQFF